MIPKTKLAYNIWQGNNSSTTFDFDFIIDKPTDLIAVIWDMTADTREVLEYETDYTIAEFSNVNGSSITYPIADDAEKLQENEKIILLAARDVQQSWDFYSSEKFNPQRYEDAIDYIVTIQKQFERDINRSLKVPLGLDTTPEEYLENIETKIENLEKEVTAIKSEIKIINGKIVKIDSRLTVAEGKIVAMDGRLTVVEEKTEALSNKLNAVSNKQNEIEQRVIKNEKEQNALKQRVSNNESKCEALDVRVTKNEKDISDLKAGGGGQSPTGGGTMYVCYAVNKAKCQEGSSLVDYVANKQAIDNGELPSTISYAVGGENPNLVVTTAKGKTITISSIPDLDVSTVAALEGGGVGVWTRCVDSDGLFKLVHHSNFVYSNANADFRVQYTLEDFPNGIIVQYTGVDPFETWELDGEGNWSEFNAVPLETFEIVEKEDGSYGVSVLFFQLPNIGVNLFNFNQNAAVYNIMTMYDLPIVEKNTTGALSSVLDIQLDSTFKVDCRKNLGDNYAVEDFPYGLKERFNIEIELNSNELNDVYVSATTDALTCYKEDAENGVCQYFQYIGKTENGKLYTSFEIPMYAPDMYLKFEKLGVAMDVEVDKFKLEALGYQETRIESGSVKVVEEEDPYKGTSIFKAKVETTTQNGKFEIPLEYIAGLNVVIDWGDETEDAFSDGCIKNEQSISKVSHTYESAGTYEISITTNKTYISAKSVLGYFEEDEIFKLNGFSSGVLKYKEILTPAPILYSNGNPVTYCGMRGDCKYPADFFANNSQIKNLYFATSNDTPLLDVSNLLNITGLYIGSHSSACGGLPKTIIDANQFSLQSVAGACVYSDIKDALPSMLCLQRLRVSGFEVEEITDTLFANNSQLRELYIVLPAGLTGELPNFISQNSLLESISFAASRFNGIPTDYFANALMLKKVVGLGSLVSIPSGLFSNNPNLESVSFSKSSDSVGGFSSIPQGLFANNPMLNFVTFSGQTSLGTVPADLFDIPNRSQPINFSTVFKGCSAADLPAGLFSNPLDTQFSQALYGCGQSGSISKDIFGTDKTTRFVNNSSVNFDRCFVDAGKMNSLYYQDAPDLWNYSFEGTSIVVKSDCFDETPRFSNASEIPDEWK